MLKSVGGGYAVVFRFGGSFFGRVLVSGRLVFSFDYGVGLRMKRGLGLGGVLKCLRKESPCGEGSIGEWRIGEGLPEMRFFLEKFIIGCYFNETFT